MDAKPVQSPQVTEQDLEPTAGAKRTTIVIVCAIPSLWEQQTALLRVPGLPSVGLAGRVSALGIRFQLCHHQSVETPGGRTAHSWCVVHGQSSHPP